MADVRPFQGILYNPERAPDLAAVTTPPYDVISPAAQVGYYERHPLNIIRLELGQEHPKDDHLDNRYTRAATTFARWRLEGVLQQDVAPGMYIYQQHFSAQGQAFTRTSLLARVRLEPWEAGVILPHERTLTKAKDDRLHLLRACTANLSPIMAVFDDDESAVSEVLATATKAQPLAHFTDDAGEAHRLWHISDAVVVAQLHAVFTAKQLYIADGHHRYETALTYRDEVSELHRGLTPDEAANFVLMALVALDDPGLVVLPTHRLLRGLDSQRIAEIPTALQPFWELEQLSHTLPAEALTTRLAAAGTDAHAIIVATHKHRWLARLNDTGRARMQTTDEPAAWQALDVAVAHELIIDTAFGIPRSDVATSEQISYTHDITEALAAVETDAAQVAVLLNATPAQQMRDVAKVGGRMPQKSTYFYPKLITGAIINPVW